MGKRYTKPGFCTSCGKPLKKFECPTFDFETGKHDCYFECENPCHPHCWSKQIPRTWKEYFTHWGKLKYITVCCGQVFFDYDYSYD